MTDKMPEDGFSTEKFNQMKENITSSEIAGPTAEELSLMDEKLKEIYKKYYPETARDERILHDIKESGAEVFFLRLCAMQDKMSADVSITKKADISQQKIDDSAGHEDQQFKYPELLASASDMLHIYKSVCVAKSQEFVEIMSGDDVEKIMAAYENPLYANVDSLVNNEQKLTSVADIEQIIQTKSGRMDTLNIICDSSSEIQQMLGDMRAEANIKYAASGITTGYIHPSSADKKNKKDTDNQEIADYIDAHPKAVLALSILNEERKAIGLPIEKLDTAEALQKRCEKADVKNITEKIRYTDRTESIKNATKTAASYAMIEKTSRGTSVHTA